ncbi:peptidylprolyl isomerase [Algoriphagus namhaensis]|uniref:Peptidylprolyl isomerase n=1 Tax=Algoriphagus namhaensis TaxID=915353 RepID=A0ABV8ANM3_9BACT
MVFSFRLASFIVFTFTLVAIQSNSLAALQSDQLMTIGGEPVDKSELVYLLSKGQSDNPAQGGLSREEFEENLERFINYKLKVKEAEALNLDQTEEFISEFSTFQETLKAPFLIKNSLEEGELRKAYSRLQEVIRASHILFQFPPNASKEDSLIVLRMALKVRDEIASGGNINELAVEYSDDPSAKMNKGDLGYFTSLQMVPPFEDAVYNMQPGEISSPVLTSFGYHIIQLMDRRPNPGQVKVSHLLVRIDPDNPNGEDIAKRKVADVYQEIQKESTFWDEIVKNYSEDLATNQKGGALPWFSVGSMIPEFEMTAFSLTEEGEISPPVKTQYGYHILRLEGKRPLESFDNMEKSLRSKILRASRSSLIESQVMAIQKSRYNFQENDGNVMSLETALKAKTVATYADAMEEAGLTTNELFAIGESRFTGSDFLAFVSQKERIPGVDQNNFDTWYTAFVATSLNKAEDQDLLRNNKEYQMTLNEYRDGILLFSLMNQEVWQKGIMDSLGQRAYYQKNLQDYQWNDRVEAFLIKVLDISQANTAKNFVSGKELNPDLSSAFKNDIESANPLAFQTSYGLMEIKDHPILSQANLSEKYQEIEANGHLHLILLGEVIPAGPKDFSETRGLVIRDYQESLDQALIQRLRSKYSVVIDEEAKEETFIALNQ